MQEYRPEDEDDRLTDHPTLSQVADALADEKTRAVMLHKPEQIVTLRSGKKYKVQPDGSWQALSSEGEGE